MKGNGWSKFSWLVFVGVVLIVAFFALSWRYEFPPSRSMSALFSGLLVLTSLLLWTVSRNTLALQKQFDKRELAKASPRPIFHDVSRLKHAISFDARKEEGQLELHFNASNPGGSTILIESVQIKEESIGNPVASRVKWFVRLPILATSPLGGPYSNGFPAPVFPDGYTEVTAFFTFHDGNMYDAGTKLDPFHYSITYRLGNSDESKAADGIRRG